MKNSLLMLLAVLLPGYIFAQPANNDCANATELTVSTTTVFTNTVTGTTQNATASGVAVACAGVADDDVWYKFTATATRHAISFTNITVSVGIGGVAYEVYDGSCSGALVLCTRGGYDNIRFPDNLTIGATYYIRVFTTGGPPQLPYAGFTLGIATPGTAISVTNDEYTVEELVENIFSAGTVSGISNIAWSTGTNFGATQPNGIGYFEDNGSIFPFESGIILSTGNAIDAEGPNGYPQIGGTSSWAGDNDLNTVFTSGYVNATSLEFDFVPNVNNISLSYIFASEEYGVQQCLYPDAVAILLTNVTEGTPPQNIAVVPNSFNQPVTVQTIRNSAYNSNCPSTNAAFFDAYITPATMQGATNFNGKTVSLVAQSYVDPGDTYHIKFIVADAVESSNDSAVFLKGGSFTSGPQFDDNIIMLSPAPYVVCEYSPTEPAPFVRNEVAANIVESTANYTFSWYASAENAMTASSPLPLTYGMNGTQEIVYFRVTPNNNTTVFDIVPITLVADPIPDSEYPGIVIMCDEDGVPDDIITINLTAFTEYILNGENPDNVILTFYPSFEEAQQQINPITNPESYVTGEEQLAFTVEYANSQNGCFYLGTIFPLIEVSTATQITTQNNVHSLCLDENGQVIQPLILQSGQPSSYTVLWYRNGIETLSAATINYTTAQPGDYTYTVFNGACTSPMSDVFTVTLSGPAAPVGNGYTITGQQITVNVEGEGQYEYSLNAEGPYGQSNVIDAPGPGIFTVYVNDINGCGTIMITGITITIPAPPIAEEEQQFEEGQTLADLNVAGQNIQWYADAEITLSLASDTLLEDGATYFVTQTIDNVESTPTAISVYLMLWLEDSHISNLRYYPNPVNNELKLEHTATLLSATLYNALGQQLQKTIINNTQATLNMAGLANGIYLIKVQAEDGERILKVVKS